MTTLDTQRAILRSSLGRAFVLPEEAWSTAERLFIPHHFAAGEHVIEAGSSVSALFFVTSGVARYYYLDARGREFNKSFSSVSALILSPGFIASTVLDDRGLVLCAAAIGILLN
ncbi:MAG: hypothetical protein M0Q49_09845 [Porticoccaceae bacterium]|jgi:CRP-like cAMP-binding protein|nr:hypothetical protein [Porticoccaceae bacterium]